MEEAAAVPPGSQGVFFLPHFGGAVIPQVDTKSLGAFVGLSDRTKRGACARAVIEGLDYQYRQLLEAFESATGKSVERVIAVGGATYNKFWMQNKADIAGRPVEVPAIEEATPLGAAILAGIGVGIFKDEPDAFRKTYHPGETYTPNVEAAAQYETFFQIYKQIYPNLKEVSRSIFDLFH
jgi:xylulokinase